MVYELRTRGSVGDETVITEVSGPSLYQGLFLDFMILSITNGISLTLVLHPVEIGTAMIGIIASILGVVYLDVDGGLIARQVYEKTIADRIFFSLLLFHVRSDGCFIFFDM